MFRRSGVFEIRTVEIKRVVNHIFAVLGGAGIRRGAGIRSGGFVRFVDLVTACNQQGSRPDQKNGGEKQRENFVFHNQ